MTHDAPESDAVVAEPPTLRDLEQRLDYHFRDPERLEQALTHASALDGRMLRVSERLEFLGDAVMGLVVSELLLRAYPRHDEGRLSKYRAALVNTANFATVAQSVGLDEHLRLGKGEEKTGGRRKESILADAFEAVMGAIFLDGGYEAVRRVIAVHFSDQVDAVAARGTTDAKTELQELCQDAYRETPVYRVIAEEGPDHAREFVVEAVLGENVLAQGRGRSKRAAEQAAALAALGDERAVLERVGGDLESKTES